MSATATPTPSTDQIAEVGGFRLESSSLAPSTETAQQTLERVIADRATPPPAAPGTEPAPAPSTPPPTTDADPGDEGATPKAAGEDGGKKPSKLRVRHDELQARLHATTRELHQVRGEREAEERRLIELRQQREALERGHTPSPKSGEPAPKQPAPADDPAVEWDGPNGYEAQGKSFSEFMRDRDAQVQRQTLREVKAEQDRLAAEQAALREEEQGRMTEARMAERTKEMVRTLSQDPAVAEALKNDEFLSMPRTPFMTALIRVHSQGADVLKHLALNPADGYAFAQLPPMTEPVMQAFRETSDPVTLFRALANNPTEAERILTLAPYQALRALAALESSATGASASGSPAAAPRQPVASPLPARVGSTHSVATARPIHELGTDDFDEFYARTQAGENARS